MIQGGWDYIGAAYTITWLVLGLYAFSLWYRHKQLQRRESRLP